MAYHHAYTSQQVIAFFEKHGIIVDTGVSASNTLRLISDKTGEVIDLWSELGDYQIPMLFIDTE